MEEFHGSLAIDFCRHKPPLVIRVWTWVSKVVLLHSQRRSFYTERSHVPAWEGKKTFIYISVQQLATLKLSPYCRHDNTKTMSVRVHAVTRQQKATAEEKIEEESETDGAEREESSEGMCRLEFKFIVKKRKKHYWKLGWELSNQTKSYSVEMERESQKAWDSIGD